MSQAAATLEISTPTVQSEFAKFEQFAKVMLDAYVLLDNNGRIVKGNQMLAQLCGQTTRQLLKVESVDHILTFSVDSIPLRFKELIQYDSAIRIDEVRGFVTGLTDERNFILSLFPIISPETQQKLGLFLLIRDVTAETQLQDQYKSKAIQSITDPLTSLFTRAYFEEFLTGQINRLEGLPKAERFEVSLVMCDIDFFKKINDTYGHQAGDHVLRIVARIMKTTFRKTDVCCRYGGEEFLVILPAADAQNAAAAANKLRHAIQNEVIVYEDRPIPVTMSCGVATIQIGKETYTETLARADQSLYECKHNGRNMVALHDGEKIVLTPRS